jgi:predicted DNA-binding protein with PD1-like motif
MKTKWISKKTKTLAIVFDAGDEVMDGLLKVARGGHLIRGVVRPTLEVFFG